MYQSPPVFTTEEMTTSPITHLGNSKAASSTFANPSKNKNSSNVSVVSDISMFTSAPQRAMTKATTSGNLEHDHSESSVDPALVAEQERLWQEIQVRVQR